MRDEWNEELRRAYDRGYWDARREYEHHLSRSHSGEQQGRGSESYSGGMNRNSDHRGGSGSPVHGMSEFSSGTTRGNEGRNYGSWSQSDRGSQGDRGSQSQNQGGWGESNRGNESQNYGGGWSQNNRGSETQRYGSGRNQSERSEGYFDPRTSRTFGMEVGSGRSSHQDNQHSSGSYRSSDRDRYSEHPPGESRSRFEERSGRERYEGGGRERHDDRDRNRGGEDRGFFERAGDEINSWFDRDERRDSGLSRGFDRGITGR